MLGKKLIQAASGSAAGGGLGIEDVFSTWLYTGNSSTQTITNGIDLAGEGGLVWIKSRSGSYGSTAHVLFDTARGANHYLSSNATGGQDYVTPVTDLLTAFSSTGFSLGTDATLNWCNALSTNYASWTFRKAPGFFDVVTWTGDGSDPGMRISHSLGSAPGCIIVKKVNAAGSWYVFHRSTGDLGYTSLDSTGSVNTLPAGYGWDVTATDFRATAGLGLSLSGATFVAYLFAHDEQIFGEGGDQSVIKCGSYTGTGAAGNFVSLGWEPQWVMIKPSSTTGGWVMFDNMRGVATGGNDNRLEANVASAESTTINTLAFDSTGFTLEQTGSATNGSGSTYVYIAIRRGPMKTPTSGTEVFSVLKATASTGTVRTTSFPIDLQILSDTNQAFIGGHRFLDRLRGVSTNSTAAGASLSSPTTGVEDSGVPHLTLNFSNTGFTDPSPINGASMVWWNFRRAPGFFDVVAYTGTGSARTVSHNLGVAPELMIVKQRSGTATWAVYHTAIGAGNYLQMDISASAGSTFVWNNTNPTSTVFSVGTNARVNASSATYIAYLFATLPGISKVGSYTGTGTTLNVDCGFTAGARFVLIKRTDSTGDWYVWDTARGIVSGNDPYLRLNSTAAEVTSTDYIDPLSSGFQISSSAPAAINANGGSYIFLAIA